MTQPPWNTGTLLSTSSAYWQGCTLQTAVRLDIFSLLDSTELSSATIAHKLQTDKRATTALLDALTAMELLKKEKEHYSNSDAAQNLLNKNSHDYMGHIILHHHHILDGWAQLDTAVTTGKPVSSRSYGEEIERQSFLMGMYNLARINGPKIAATLDLRGRKHLVDIGGGPSTYAAYFCLANPELHATIVDRATTEPFARKVIHQFELEERIDFLAGDLHSDPLPTGLCDVAWLSHILHSSGPEQCQELIDKTIAALQPGGLIIIHDFILNDDKDGPRFPALFALNMLIATPLGRCYTEKELRAMLSRGGVRDVKRIPFTSPNDSGILYGWV